MQAIPRFKGHLEVSCEPYTPENLQKHDLSQKIDYFEQIKPAFEPYEQLIKDLPDDVVIRYRPEKQFGSDQITLEMKESLIYPQLKTSRMVQRSWESFLPFEQKPDEVSKFRKWLPKALLKLLYDAKYIAQRRLEEQITEGKRQVNTIDGWIHDLTSATLKAGWNTHNRPLKLP